MNSPHTVTLVSCVIISVHGVSLFAQIEVEIADGDYGLVLVSFQTNKKIFFSTS